MDERVLGLVEELLRPDRSSEVTYPSTHGVLLASGPNGLCRARFGPARKELLGPPIPRSWDVQTSATFAFAPKRAASWAARSFRGPKSLASGARCGAQMSSEPTDQHDEGLARTVAHLLRANAGHGAKFADAPGKTIEPPRDPGPDSTWHLTRRSGLEMGETLGQGGMGVVKLARQLTLDREVAVKTVQPKLQERARHPHAAPGGADPGRLEHPNILPVYDICLRRRRAAHRAEADRGARVEPAHAPRRGDPRRVRGRRDALEWNLGILMQVCNAVHFAHSRGIVHRDLKPENVMIGEFGEVYVLDWGIAVRIEDDGTGRFPLASDAKELAGTPQYMAPEMLGRTVARISPRTDVYLLGAILYEIIAGAPPHQGKDMPEMMQQIVLVAAGAARRAARPSSRASAGWRMDPRARAPLRERRGACASRLSRFLEHAGSRRLAEQALVRTNELRRQLDEPAPHSRSSSERIQTLFGECRFAYRQALASWPENDLAVAGQERALRAMIDYELAQHNPRSAATLLSSLGNARPGPACACRSGDDRLRAQRATHGRARALQEEARHGDRSPRAGHRRRRARSDLDGGAAGSSPSLYARYPNISRLPAIAFAVGVDPRAGHPGHPPAQGSAREQHHALAAARGLRGHGGADRARGRRARAAHRCRHRPR